MKTNPNDSIQPHKYSETKGSIVYHKETTGLTKREYFAAKAMQGLLANSEYMTQFDGQKYLMQDDIVAGVAVQYADALISALNETSTSKP